MADDKIVSSRSIYDGRVIHLRLETLKMPDGATYEREIIRHNGAVAMLPLEADGSVILVKQYRAGSEQEMLELPAGTLNPGEDRQDCARRELQEEIGFYPENLVELGQFWTAASYTSELITIYLVEGLRPSKLAGDRDEHLTPVRMPFEEALRMAYANQIEDGKTLIGLMWAAQRKGRSK
jgi:ADP-ribose pyrophosphatase